MEEKKRQRCIYVTARQKKKLIELMNKHPELISCKVTQDFNYGDSHKLWQSIANECNGIPGAKKTWRQWRKTWHDIRSKTKKKQEAEINGELPISSVLLASEEQGALDVKNNSCNEDYHRTPEFVPLSDNQHDIFSEEMSAFISEPKSPPESKVFTHEHKTSKLELSSSKHSQKKSENCYFNCDVLAAQEQRKIQIKEDYLNFKKDYLKQKLKLLKEQTEALKSIAKELSK